MTKAEIVQAVYTRLGGFSKKESADLVDLVFETMKETLGRGEKIKISGFGNFVVREKKGRPADPSLVVLDTHPPTYLQDVHDRIMAAVLASSEGGTLD